MKIGWNLEVLLSPASSLKATTELKILKTLIFHMIFKVDCWKYSEYFAPGFSVFIKLKILTFDSENSLWAQPSNTQVL